MITNLYAIFDDKAKAYMQPFFAATAGLAIRGFADAVNDPQTSISRHPSDFTLFELGTFDDQNGLVTPHQTPSNLGVAVTYKEA